MLPYTFLIHYSSMPKHPSKSDCFIKKPPKNRFEDMELTAGGSYSMWNSFSELEKKRNLQGWSINKSHSLGVFFFGLGVFKGCNTLLWKLTCYDLRVFQNFQDKPRNFRGYLQRLFLIHLVFFFWNRPLIKTQTFCTGCFQCTCLELLPEPP